MEAGHVYGTATTGRTLVAVALLTTALAACSTAPGDQRAQATSSSPPAKPTAAHGPDFPECGGVSDETVTRLTGIPQLRPASRNSVGCQWLVRGGRRPGVLVSFSWFRGSPIGRERKSEELSRDRVNDITIDGHDGFIAMEANARLGDYLCDIGIQYHDDFFEWSVQFSRKPFPNPCDIVVELSHQSIAAAK